MKKSQIISMIQEEIQGALKERVFIDPSPSSGRDVSMDDEGNVKFGTVAGGAKSAIQAITRSYPELKSNANVVASILLSAKARSNDVITVKGMDYEIKPHILDALLNFDKAVASQEDAYENPKTQKVLKSLSDAAESEYDLSSYMGFLDNDRDFTPSLGKPQTQRFVKKELGLDESNHVKEENIGLADIEEMGFEAGENAWEIVNNAHDFYNKPDLEAFKKGFIQGFIDGSGSQLFEGEENLNEMAKIKGDLKSAIEKIVKANPDLENLPLKKKIKADKSVIDALGDESLYDNQLNKFIALVKGERELGKRGRKKGSTTTIKDTKPKSTTDTKSKKEPKSKSLSKEEKEQKFNTGLKFIKKYKDDKPKIDAYLKKAKEEYKLSKALLDDLKRAAGREV